MRHPTRLAVIVLAIGAVAAVAVAGGGAGTISLGTGGGGHAVEIDLSQNPEALHPKLLDGATVLMLTDESPVAYSYNSCNVWQDMQCGAACAARRQVQGSCEVVRDLRDRCVILCYCYPEQLVASSTRDETGLVWPASPR